MTCTLQKKSESMRLLKCENMRVLFLKGSPIQRARMHGELMRTDFTSENLELFLRLAVRDKTPGTFAHKAQSVALEWLARYAQRNADSAFHNEASAFANAAGIKKVELQRALMLPDLAAFVWAMSGGESDAVVSQGCTSAIFSDGPDHFLQGRNLDFAGSPSYDSHPLLVVHLPEDHSSELKHVAIGTEGLQYAGISGFNEAGITFAVHQNYTHNKTLSGNPMPFVGEKVLRSARNLSEALEILKNHRPGPLWTFVLSDLKTHEALTVEISQKHFEVRRKTDHAFAQTNFLVNENLRKSLAFMDGGTRTNAKFRFDFALDQMKNWKNPKAEQMAKLLAFQKSSSSFSPISDVQKTLSIQSLIYEKQSEKRNNFYVTMDLTPAPSGRWLKFDLNSFWQMTDSFPYEVIDFLKTPTDIRKQQMAWADVYVSDILKQHADVLKKLPELVNSVDSWLALAASQLQSGDDREALVSAQKGLMDKTPDTHPLVIEALRWVELASLWNMNKKDLALTKALGFMNNGITDRAIKKEVQQILKKKNPSEKSLRVGFDFFGGSLLGMPSSSRD